MRRHVLHRCATVLIALCAIVFPAGMDAIGSAWAAAASPQRSTIAGKEPSAKDGGVSTLSCAPQDISVSIPDGIVVGAGQSVVVPILLSDVTGQGVISGDVVVTFNAAVVQATGVGAGTLTSGPGCLITPNLSTPGQANISAFCTDDMTGAGSLAVITFQAVGATGTSTSLHIASAQLNEGNPTDCDDDGSLSICGTDNDCDGVDDDCDGTPDDNYVPVATTCGSGTCQASGTRTCVAGVEQDSCVSPVTMSIPDGVVGSPAQTIAVPILVSDVTGKGVLSADVVVSFNPAVVQATSIVAGTLTSGGDCTITPNLTLPGQATVSVFCSNEMTGGGSLVSLNFLMLGAAGTSTPVHIVTAQLNEGVPGVCPDDGSISICGADNDCDGVDDDCDGTPDDNYVPTGTTCGVGACAGNTGQLECQAGTLVDSCDPIFGATLDTDCDAIDDDCDGINDDGYVPTGTTCGVGACAGNTGQLECQAGTLVDSCDPIFGATLDTDCDAIDDDCDGINDDGYIPTGTTCGVGACSGNTGQLECQAGTLVDSCDPIFGATLDTDCDAIDDDCDGINDDGYVPTGTTCGVGACAGNTGQLECQAGTLVDSCDPIFGATLDTDCDAIDDDCDGINDDGYVPTGTTCGVGACSGNTGELECQAGTLVDSCDPIFGATLDTDCDAIDDDCDGINDDGYVPTGTTCGVGACAGNAGQLECQAGTLVDTCDPTFGATLDTDCDAIDDDCDGANDDGYVPTGTTCGVGACAGNTGELECQAGTLVDTCDPTFGATLDTDCDAIDDDCDGANDDGYVPTGTTCGVGACSGNAGQLECQAGTLVDSCDPTFGATLDTDCDAIDDDCDGINDDGYVPTGTTCGVGACSGNTGELECQAGTLVDTCDPTFGATLDTDCDAIDDDCDGANDDGYVPTGTTCGVGACSGNAGQLECQAGTLVDSCDPTFGATLDTDCDAIDDDCDGINDDGYVPTGTTCGVGACAGNAGQLECQAGTLVDTCDPTFGATPDTDCDAVDDDCDGTDDDGYVPTGTTCGSGTCAGTGTTTCVGGVEGDTCTTPGTTISIPASVTAIPSASVAVPVLVTDLTGLGVVSADLRVSYDASVAQAQAVSSGSLTSGCTVQGNVSLPGQVLISVFCTAPLSGAGSLAEITFLVVGAYGDSSPLVLTSAVLNEGVPASCAADGSLDICGAEFCDGLDNNCNGQIDETDPQVGQACTTGLPGVCAPGTYVCGSGMLVCQGLVGPSPEVCDGLDEDCDGLIDEGLGSTTCGTGACSVTVANCVGGQPQTCTPGAPLGPTDPTCDDIDDDCDGMTDDDFVSQPTQCGDPLCGQMGATSCVGGVVHDSCVAPGAAISIPATLTAIPSATPTVPVMVSDLTGQGVVSADLSVSYDPAILQPSSVGPGSLTGACSVLGNLSQPGQVLISIFCTSPLSGAGSLAEISFLVVGNYGDVSPLGLPSATLNEGIPTACAIGGSLAVCGVELCDGLDNDCDGTNDDGNPGGGVQCGSDVGECVAGITACSGGSLDCQGDIGPVAEVCDGLDNNCDGANDDGNPGGGAQCGSDVGECVAGITACSGGSLDCQGDIGPVAEVCDGLDNNCDGANDDGNPGGGAQCGSDVGECVAGITACSGGSLDCQGDIGPVAEVCDGLDNNCDGANDDGNPGGGVQCGSDVGECVAGITACSGGSLDCQGDIGPVAEVCDGLDNDCDGANDDGNPGGGVQCGSDVGECVAGITACSGGSLDCQGDIGPVAEVCDGLDNDCDAQLDETDPQLGQTCTTGLPGVCDSGTTVCTTGHLACQQDTPASTEICDGLDNDCDSSVDEALGTITCGLGICQRTVDACVMGTPNTCVPGTPTSESCNALDDDCDGSVDDGFNVGAVCELMPGTCPPPAHVVCTADGTGSVCLNDPLLAVAHAAPSSIAEVSWVPIPGAVIYDVIRIDLLTLRGTTGDYALATELCLANDIAATSVNDPDVPLSTEGYGYLMRAAGCTGGSSYESGSFSQVGLRDPEIALSGLQCP